MMKLYVIIFFVYTVLVLSAPTGRGKEEHREKGPPEKKPRPEERKCYFNVIRKTKYETQPRPDKSTVSSNCKNEKLIRIGDLASYHIDPNTGERNAIELLLCRGSGECDLNYSETAVQTKWKYVYICEDHADELLRKWSDSHSKYRKLHIYKEKHDLATLETCSMPDNIGTKHTKRPTERLDIVKVSESDALLKKYGTLVHPGIPVCQHHKTLINSLQSPSADLLPTAAVETTTQTPMEVDKENQEEEQCTGDPDYKQPGETKSPLMQAFKEFSKATGVDRVCSPKISFGHLKEETKQKKVCAVRKLINVLMGLVAPDDTEELKERVKGFYNTDNLRTTGTSKNMDNVMKQVAAQFFAAENRISRLIVLSLVANSMPYLKVEKYIPDLSIHMYQAAKKFARRKRNVEEPPKTLQKYNPEAVHVFVEFITSPLIMIGLPFGVLKVKMPDGSKHEIPNSIRQQSKTEIYNMYLNYLKETDQMHLELSKSSIFRILNVCAATERQSTTCVDYFVADAMEAFDNLHVIVDGWIQDQADDKDILLELKTKLFEIAQYLRTDYRLHVKADSRVPDHCSTHALSDKKDKNFAKSCSSRDQAHTHDLRCVRCEHMNSTLEYVKQYSKFLIPKGKGTKSTDKERENLEKRKTEYDSIEEYLIKIVDLKKHYMRAAVTNQERTEIIGSLKDNEALITLDFAQKFLPKWHREKQIDYFAKRGINYHVSHVAAQIGPNLTQHSFVHIYDTEVTQNSALVVLTIAHVISELKKVGIKKVSLRSDNAGAYHCASTIGSLHWLNETFGVNIDTYTFSEAQNGKSSSDRDANRVKRKAESYVDKDHFITTSEEFFTALQSGTLLNGVSIHHGSVAVLTDAATKWPGISNLNHFKLEVNGIRARKYGNIGAGQFFEKSNMKPLTGTYSFKEAGYVSSGIGSIEEERKALLENKPTKFWYHNAQCKKTSTCQDEDDDVSPEIDEIPKNSEVIGDLFACSEPGCSATFLKAANLEKHHLRGQHKISPERLNMMDYSLNYYVQRLEEVDQSRTLKVVKDAVQELKEKSGDSYLDVGWALPSKHVRVPFDDDVKKFLVECFEEGTKKGAKHVDPRTVEKRMTTARKADGSLRFTVGQRKDFRQIAAFFSREAEKRRSAQTTRPKRAHLRHKRAQEKKTDGGKDEGEFIVPEEEHEDAGWLRYKNDEATPTSGDEYFSSIVNNGNDPIFEYDN